MSEFLKNLWGKLYAWALPSALTLGAYWLFVYPKTTAFHGWLGADSDISKAGIFAALTATIAFCLNAFSTPLYGILEGYLLWPKWLQKRGSKRQLKCKRDLERGLAGTGWMRNLALERIALYPLDDEQVVPTRFGNAIRSFETYGKTRFNLDSQTLWNELCAVAPRYIQTAHDSARSSVDFFVASIYLSAALGLITLAVAGFEGFKLSVLVICVPAFLVTLLCHWLVVRATGEWSETVQALVNVGRVKLADRLGLQLPDTLDEEKKMWGLVTSYVFFNKTEDGVQLDRFRKRCGTVSLAGNGRERADGNGADNHVDENEDEDELIDENEDELTEES
jgi:hypothetical protein